MSKQNDLLDATKARRKPWLALERLKKKNSRLPANKRLPAKFGRTCDQYQTGWLQERVGGDTKLVSIL